MHGQLYYLLADSLKCVHKIMMIHQFSEKNSIVRQSRYSAAAVSLLLGIASHAMSPDTWCPNMVSMVDRKGNSECCLDEWHCFDYDKVEHIPSSTTLWACRYIVVKLGACCSDKWYCFDYLCFSQFRIVTLLACTYNNHWYVYSTKRMTSLHKSQQVICKLCCWVHALSKLSTGRYVLLYGMYFLSQVSGNLLLFYADWHYHDVVFSDHHCSSDLWMLDYVSWIT